MNNVNGFDKFEKVVAEEIDNSYDTSNCRVIYFENAHLNVLDHEIQKWTSNVPVMIQAGTGAGKTTWVLKKLLPVVSRYGRKLVLLLNRAALSAQVKSILLKEVLQNYHSAGSYDALKDKLSREFETGKNGCCDLGPIVVMTIQAFTESDLNYDVIGAVVVDEAHFFKADSLFNAKTGYAFDKIFTVLPNAIKIFISATLQNVIPNIINKGVAEKPYEYYGNIFPDALRIDGVSALFAERILNETTYYNAVSVLYIFSEISRNYNIQPLEDKGSFELSLEPLLTMLKENENQKTVIFANNKAKAENIRNELEKAGVTAVTISSYSKTSGILTDDYVAYHRLLQSASFKEQVLITTSVLDNGVNFMDAKIKNIFIDADEPVEFLQMMGRVRFPWNNDKYEVNVYFINYTENHFKKRLNYLNSMLTAAEKYLSLTTQEDQVAYFNHAARNKSSFCTLVQLESDGTIIFNKFAVEEMQRLYNYYAEILSRISNVPFTYRYLNFSYTVFLLRHFTAKMEKECREEVGSLTLPIANFLEYPPFVKTKKLNDFKQSIIPEISGPLAYLDTVNTWFKRKYQFPKLMEYHEQRNNIINYLNEASLIDIQEKEQEAFLKKLKDFAVGLLPNETGTGKSLQAANKMLSSLKINFSIVGVQRTLDKKRQTVWQVKERTDVNG